MSKKILSDSRISRRQFGKSMVKSTGILGSAGVALPFFSCIEKKEKLLKEDQKFVVDTHMHVWANDQKRYPVLHPYKPKFSYDDIPSEATTEMLLADMDQNGVTHSILIQVIFHGWDNSYVVDSIRSYPDRFRGHGLIDPTDPQVAKKLEYWVKEHGLSGMRFSPIYYVNGNNGGDAWLNDSYTDKLWKTAEKLDTVFNFYISTQQLPKLEEMVRRHPDVKICIDHLSQIDLAVADPMPELKKLLAFSNYPNVWVKVSELTSVSKAPYPFYKFHHWVKTVYEQFGPDRLLWGTGYPGSARSAYNRPMLSQELSLIREKMKFVTQEDVEKILGLNAAKLWKLS